MPELTIAAVQLAAHDRSGFAAAWSAVRSQLEAAAAQGAQLAVLPEATLPGYVLGEEPFDERETAAQLEECRAIAKRAGMVVVVGAARREGDRVRNSAIVIESDGSIAGTADKHFLWHFDRQWFAPGETLEPVRTSIGCIGALVCADGRIPTIARALVDRGAQILVMPTAWVTSGRDPQHLENAQADLLARVRARENGVPFVAANKCGVELRAVAYCGKSQIVDANGTLAAIASQDRPENLLARVELRPPAPARALPHVPDFPVRSAAARIAITARHGVDDRARLLRILEADELIGADFSPCLDDAAVADPGAPAALRLRGCTLAVWQTAMEPEWQVTYARARALELRMYVVVIDAARDRAYAVDPDGAILCGTFDGYEIASFSYDPARAAATFVAPGTDVIAGLTRAAADAAH